MLSNKIAALLNKVLLPVVSPYANGPFDDKTLQLLCMDAAKALDECAASTAVTVKARARPGAITLVVRIEGSYEFGPVHDEEVEFLLVDKLTKDFVSAMLAAEGDPMAAAFVAAKDQWEGRDTVAKLREQLGGGPRKKKQERAKGPRMSEAELKALPVHPSWSDARDHSSLFARLDGRVDVRRLLRAELTWGDNLEGEGWEQGQPVFYDTPQLRFETNRLDPKDPGHWITVDALSLPLTLEEAAEACRMGPMALPKVPRYAEAIAELKIETTTLHEMRRVFQAINPDLLDMYRWFKGADSGFGPLKAVRNGEAYCGTAACLGGHLACDPWFQALGLRVTWAGGLATAVEGTSAQVPMDGTPMLSSVLGIELDESEDLFSQHAYPTDIDEPDLLDLAIGKADYLIEKYGSEPTCKEPTRGQEADTPHVLACPSA